MLPIVNLSEVKAISQLKYNTNMTKGKRKRFRRSAKDAAGDPAVRITISLLRSTKAKLKKLASDQGFALSNLINQLLDGKIPKMDEYISICERKFTKSEMEFLNTMIELLGPLTFSELIDLLQKHQQKKD